MKAYGLPRDKDIECPDLVDIQIFGLKSSAGNIKKNGSIKNSFRSSDVKRQTRRFWKRKQRAINKKMCIEEI